MREPKREFMMKAHVYKDQDVLGWYWSQKLDGMRCFWDGGISIGNHLATWTSKTHMVGTGLWSNLGNSIKCPKWFTDGLPNVQLDGELYVRDWKSTISACKTARPGPGWKDVTFNVFDIPSRILSAGYVNNRQLDGSLERPSCRFDKAQEILINLPETEFLRVHPQKIITHDTDLYGILEKHPDWEGLMLRSPSSIWEPHRSHNLLKLKIKYDAEATVIGYKEGENAKEGSVGSLLVRQGDKTFSVGGLSKEESVYGYFKNGDVITYTYKNLSSDGIPTPASFLRRFEP